MSSFHFSLPQQRLEGDEVRGRSGETKDLFNTRAGAAGRKEHSWSASARSRSVGCLRLDPPRERRAGLHRSSIDEAWPRSTITGSPCLPERRPRSVAWRLGFIPCRRRRQSSTSDASSGIAAARRRAPPAFAPGGRRRWPG